MRRISTATKSVDKFGAGKHGFTNGNVVGGIPATDLEDVWFDHVQEEIAGVIESAGIALDPANRAQLLAALRSAGVFQTPAQFDTSTKAATMAALQRALGNCQGVNSSSGAASIAASDAGKLVLLGATGTVLTLPALSAVPVGTIFHFLNITTSGTGTVQRAGADPLYMAATDVGSVAVGGGETLSVAAGAAGWYAFAGSATLKAASTTFGSSLSGNGWRKYPDGSIEQWGVVSLTANTDTTVTLPVAFPNSIYGVVTGQHYTNGSGVISATEVVVSSAPGLANFVMRANGSTGVNWRAVGR